MDENLNQGGGEQEKAPAWADAIVKRMDEFGTRLDSIEGKGGDRMDASAVAEAKKEGGEELRHEEAAKTDLAKAIGEGKKEGEEERRADSSEAEKRADEEKARADAQARENADLKRQIAAMDARLTTLTTPLSASDRDALASAQSRADSVMQMFGDSASAPLHGEDPIAYRKRLAAKLQKHSADMKDVKLDSLDGGAFAVIEDRIYADAQATAKTPAALPAGRLVPHVRMDEAGRRITTFSGDMDAWMAPFKSTGAVCKFNRDQKGA